MPQPKKAQKKYAFITWYILLLAMPMFLGIAGMFFLSIHSHRAAMEQKLSTLNHTIAIAESGFFNQIEQVLSTTVAADKLQPLTLSPDVISYYRQLWLNKVRLSSILSQIYYADMSGQSFSNDERYDQDWDEKRVDSTARPWYRGALATRGFYWTPTYQDQLSRKYTLTLSHRLRSFDGVSERVVGVDLDLQAWSQLLTNMLYGDNALTHMVLDRTTGQILVHSQAEFNGQPLQARWGARLTEQSGTFFGEEADEYVAYQRLPDRPDWLSITVQPRRDSIALVGGSVVVVLLLLSSALFIIMATVFRLRLSSLIEGLIQMARLLRLSAAPERMTLVLPDLPELAELNEELHLVSGHLQESYDAAHRDALTGLYNRRFLDERLGQLHRQGKEIVLALVDLDDFKEINDAYGHCAGDAVLRRCSVLGEEMLGQMASLCRYGGEELVVLFERVSLAEAESLLEQWRERVCGMQWRDKGLQVSFSAGIGASEGRSPEALMVLVDQALYQAKRAGKNRIHTVRGR